MNNDCKGILGWMFGHKFESYLLSSMPIKAKINIAEVYGNGIADVLDTISERRYELFCERCGERKK